MTTPATIPTATVTPANSAGDTPGATPPITAFLTARSIKSICGSPSPDSLPVPCDPAVPVQDADSCVTSELVHRTLEHLSVRIDDHGILLIRIAECLLRPEQGTLEIDSIAHLLCLLIQGPFTRSLLLEGPRLGPLPEDLAEEERQATTNLRGKHIEESVDIVQFFLKVVGQRSDLEKPEGKVALLDLFRPLLTEIENVIYYNNYIKLLSEALKLNEHLVKQYIQSSSKGGGRSSTDQTAGITDLLQRIADASQNQAVLVGINMCFGAWKLVI